MLFNSIEYIFLFVPFVLIIYLFLNKKHLIVLSKCWLILASFFFYGYLTPKYIPLLIFSIFINFAVGSALNTNLKTNKQLVFIIGIIINLLFLGYFKYMNFFIQNINSVFHSHLTLLHIILPLGISFFTFQQIAYLCDSYEGKAKEYDFLNYTLFIVFFPQLVAGPIVHHGEMIPQFNSLKNKFINWQNLSKGLFLFLIGLFKKVIIADTLAKWATLGFESNSALSFFEAWTTILSYTFQIYYDFSGYTDMALGVALMFNIKLPQNFNNPYKSIDIEDFWRRWHMTLSKFLKDYVYIPLGGNRRGPVRTYINLFLVFLICGFWHGASWMFILWGIVHGIAIIINKFWKKANIEIPKWSCWIITFIFVNFAWVLFRAKNMTIAKNIYISAFGLNGFSIPKIYGENMIYNLSISNIPSWDTMILIFIPILVILIFMKFIHEIPKNLKPIKSFSIFITILFILSLFAILNPEYNSPFIYFNF